MLINLSVHHLPSADHVVVLEQGQIKYRGSWAEVLDSGYQLSELSKSQTGHSARKNELQDKSKHVGQTKEGTGTNNNANEYDPLQDVDEEYRATYGKGFKPYAFWLRNSAPLNIAITMVTTITK